MVQCPVRLTPESGVLTASLWRDLVQPCCREGASTAAAVAAAAVAAAAAPLPFLPSHCFPPLSSSLQVPSHPAALPSSHLLSPSLSGPLHHIWRPPPGTRSLEVAVVLGHACVLSSIQLWSGLPAYSAGGCQFKVRACRSGGGSCQTVDKWMEGWTGGSPSHDGRCHPHVAACLVHAPQILHCLSLAHPCCSQPAISMNPTHLM